MSFRTSIMGLAGLSASPWRQQLYCSTVSLLTASCWDLRLQKECRLIAIGTMTARVLARIK